MSQLSRHHQAMVNALAAFTHQTLEHNNSALNDKNADVEMATFVGQFGLDLKSFMQEYGYDVRIKVKPIKD